MKRAPFRHARLTLATATVALALGSAPADAAGTLTPLGSGLQPIRILDHDVRVTINNGFAKVAVTQRFSNPNDGTVEALYAMPVPEGAALSEMHLSAGELVLDGEVLPKAQAQQVYAEEKAQGREAGLATKENYQRYEFRVSPLPPNLEVTVNVVYYQPLAIDGGVGRFVYPLAEGGTDDAVAEGFWTRNDKVEGSFSVDVALQSAWPVDDVRAPGLEAFAKPVKIDAGHWTLRAEQQGGSLAKDFVFYYRLAENLPGRVEVIPYKPAADKPGTFMLLLTPGVDLKPLTQGSDYVFVLDTSGSMQGKLATLAKGVGQALGRMQPQDRFRVVSFSTDAREVIDWTQATPENVQRAIATLGSLQPDGSTNLYDGLHLAMQDLDADRVTSMVLVTDGVTNTGLVEPREFAKLLASHDLRLFGFLLGNGANWPLMRTITEATGGFYTPVSNEDDIVGQVLLAKDKVTAEALHHVELQVSGTRDIAGKVGRKIYRGQQVVMFGRYDRGGETDVVLKASLSGQDRVYRTRVTLPAVDTAHPELERLWAMARAEDLQQAASLGQLDDAKARAAVRDLGVQYQVVNDETAMVVMRDEAFAQRGIARDNRARVATELSAQQARAAAPRRDYRVDAPQPMFPGNAHSVGSGGALGAGQIVLLLLLGVAAAIRRGVGRA